MRWVFSTILGGLLSACGAGAAEPGDFPVQKPDVEWRQLLGPEAYRVLREHGTERAFTGPYWDNKADGVYLCAGCGAPLFDAAHKYDSGTGWPSYWQPAPGAAVGTKTDRSWGMARTEVHCSRCGGHLGHVFDDGPAPTGQRYCINGVSLKFEPRNSTPAPSAPTP